MSEKKIGIYGGAFDPVHKGHMFVAENATDIFDLDKIIFVPTFLSAYNKKLTDFRHRYNMLDLAIKGHDNFEISTLEYDKKNISYTVQTLKLLKEEYNDGILYFILGEDSLLDIENWWHYEELFLLSKIIVATRSDDIDDLDYKIKILKNKYDADILKLNNKFYNISSTDIRNNIINNKKCEFIDLKVLSYIKEHNLYISGR